MILDILSEKNIRTHVLIKDWREAIHEAGILLLEDACIEESYIQRMIDIVNEYGSYIVLLKGLALAHAMPGPDVKKIGLSLITLDRPVYFGNSDNDPVKVIFALSALDHNSHMDLIGEMGKLFEDEENIEKIYKCQNSKEILELIKTTLY